MLFSKRAAAFFGMVVLTLVTSVVTLALRPAFAQTSAAPGTLNVSVQCVPVATNAAWQATLGFAGTRVVSVLQYGNVQLGNFGAGTACFEVFYQT